MQFLASSNIEEDFPKGWENEIFENEEIATNPKKKESSKIIRDLSIVRILRPDKFLISNKQLLSKVLGNNHLFLIEFVLRLIYLK